MVREATVDEVQAFFEQQGKSVVTFTGYSGSGYEHTETMLDLARQLLNEFDPATVIVNCGATVDGIGAIYDIAKQKGFMTTGIVSIQAKKSNAQLAAAVDEVFFISDETWGGFLSDSNKLSPTSEVMVSVSDIIVGIGGGAVARDEMLTARNRGKEVRFYPADMDHNKARKKARDQGLPEPTDFSGAVDEIF